MQAGAPAASDRRLEEAMAGGAMAGGAMAGGAAAGEAMRVRLAANPATAPDVLEALARDQLVTVRAAVAMNPARADAADRALAIDPDERVRMLLARKLAQLVPDMASAERERLRDRAAGLLAALVEDEAVRVRAMIADVLKEMPQAPRALVLRLAADAAMQVSEPVIRLSPLLTAEDLLALLAQPPHQATAGAIAGRAELPEAVCDAIAATADTAAITALLRNRSAAIREATLDALVARAQTHEEWHEPLVQRPRLSERAMRALSGMVATHLLEALAQRADVPAAIAAELRPRLTERLQPAPAIARAPETSAEAAMEAARRLFADGVLDEQAMLAACERGEARLAAALLAVAVDVAVSVVDRATTLRSAKGLTSLVWAAGFSMRAGVAAQAVLGRLSPETMLRPTVSGDFPLAPDEMRWQIDLLKRIGR